MGLGDFVTRSSDYGKHSPTRCCRCCASTSTVTGKDRPCVGSGFCPKTVAADGSRVGQTPWTTTRRREQGIHQHRLPRAEAFRSIYEKRNEALTSSPAHRGAGFSRADFDALVLFNQRHAEAFFVVRYNSLKFTSYVGVLHVGGLTIEAPPKADRTEVGGENKWHHAVIEMLRACGYLRLAAVSSADLRLRSASPFDLYMEAFLLRRRVSVASGSFAEEDGRSRAM